MPPKKSAEWGEIPADFVLKLNIMFSWNSKDKEFICRVCSTFLDKEELVYQVIIEEFYKMFNILPKIKIEKFA